MTTAFQPDLFQSDAFQIGGGVTGGDITGAVNVTNNDDVLSASGVVQGGFAFAGGYYPHLWLAHINGKRYVGTYEEIEAIAESVIVKTEKKPRIVIKPLRKIPVQGVPEVSSTQEDAKQVQEQLYIDLMPFLARVLEKRRQDDEDDIEVLMLL